MVHFVVALIAFVVALVIIVAKAAGRLETQEAIFYLLADFIVYYLLATLLGVG